MSINPVSSAILLAAALGLAPASAAAQRHCAASRVPAVLPAVDDVIDSTAIASLIADTGARGVLRFSIVADVGERPRVFPNGTASPPAEWLTPRVQAALREMPKPTVAWGLRLIASADSMPAITLARSEYCRPQPIPGSTGRTTIRVMTEPGSPRPPRKFPTPIVHLSSEGDLRDVTFIGSSNRELESELRRVMMGTRYHPARIDGVPVASVDTLRRR